MRQLRNRFAHVLMATLFAVSQLQAGTLVLSRKFVQNNKDKATITVQMIVDEHLPRPHRIDKGGNDGDIHMAGRSDDVKLPLVAEIMNAAQPAQKGSMQILTDSSSDNKIQVTGAWRLWFEHPSPGQMVQGDPVDKPENSNPDHVFEIHPITQFGGSSDLKSLVPIPKYKAYPAETAFPKYEALKSTLKNNGTAITITANKAGYNYTEFIMELAAKPTQVSDGSLVLATVFDVSDEEDPVVDGLRRMVFVKGTDPANAVAKLGKGDRLHVLGIPRVNLNEVLAAAKQGQTVSTRLPYEMIIVAVLPDKD
jgi:hypothetical protein